MFEFDLTLGPLHLRIAIGPESGEYVELEAGTEVVPDDRDEPTGFRGSR